MGTLGLGYVGLPLSVEFASAGLDVTGFDLSAEKVAAVNRGRVLHQGRARRAGGGAA